MTVQRPRRFALALVTLTVAASLAWSVAPAQAGQEPIKIDRVSTSDYPDVNLIVTAPSSLLGVDIGTKEWRLQEAGSARAVTVEPLRQEALSVILLIDTSRSMAGQPIIQAKNAALDFLDKLPTGTSAAVVGFNATAEVKTEFTKDSDDLAVAIDALTTEEGGTALYDAIQVGIGLLDDAPGDRTGIVVLTDGADTASTATLDEATIALANADTNFTAIELQTDDSDPAALEFFTAATGGQSLAADEPAALASVYGQIANRLANQYRIKYVSTTLQLDTKVEVIIDSQGVEAYGTSQVALPELSGRPDRDLSAEDGAVVGIAGSPGLLGQSLAFWIGIALVAAALAIGGAILFAPRLKMRELNTDAEVQADEDHDILTGVTTRATALSSMVLDRTGALPGLDVTIEQAGLDVRPGELVAIVAGASLFTGLIFGLVGGPVLGLIFFVIPLVLAPLVLKFLKSRRHMKFADQLADTLLLFSSTLRAGYGLPQAIDTVALESPEPTATEFGRVVTEARLGRPTDESLERLGMRMENEDFGWVVDAVRIQRDIGGNLAEVLDHIEETIRARARIRRQVRALTAEGRLSAIVLLSLPFAIALIIYVSNPEYITPLFTETPGRIMLGVGLGLITIGSLWLRKLVEPEF